MAGFAISGSAPEDLSSFSKEVFDVVAKYTMFAWPVLTAQCRRVNVDPMHLDKESLTKIIKFVADGVGLFTSPDKARQIESDLRLLARSP
jgi:hypothetical protein